MHPAYVYAFEVCGYLVTTDNAHTFTNEERSAWDDAIDEWCSLHPDEDGPQDA